jgi:hypothetical protein
VHYSTSSSAEVGRPGMHSCAMIRRAIASRKLGSIRNVLHRGSMPNRRALREEACPTVIVAGEEAFVAPNTVVHRFVREIPLVEEYTVANDLVASLGDMCHRTSCAMMRRAIASRKVGSIGNILHGGSMSNSRAPGEGASPTAIIAGEEAFVAPNAMVYPFVRGIPLVDCVECVEEDTVSLVASLVEA